MARGLGDECVYCVHKKGTHGMRQLVERVRLCNNMDLGFQIR